MMNLTGKILACIAGGVALLGYVPRVVGQTIYVPGGTVGSTSTSNVGIGTSTPQAKLDVGGLVRVTGNTPVPTSGPGLELSANSLAGVVEAYNRGVGPMPLYLYGSPVYFPEGNVGIGTSSPATKLHVVDTTAATALVEHSSPGTADLLLRTAASPWEFARVRSNGSSSEFASGYSVHLLADFYATPTYDGGLFIESNNSMAEYSSTAGNKALLTVRMDADGTPQTLMVVRGDSGNVGIGTTNPTQKLAVNGTIRAKEVVVDTGWSDYVFDDSYRLAPLSEVEQRIKADKHLPGIPSAQEVAEHGVTLGEMQSKLLAKIEELTLHVIEQEKLLRADHTTILAQQAEIAALRTQVGSAGLPTK